MRKSGNQNPNVDSKIEYYSYKMDNQDTYRYQSGRGLPTYLLSRKCADSSTDSDEASRIFAASASSMTSDEDSESSFI